MAFEHMLQYGSTRQLTEEELANAIRLDPSQIAGLGPSLEALIAMLEERKRKILQTYETSRVLGEAAKAFHAQAARMRAPGGGPGDSDDGAGDGRTAAPRSTASSGGTRGRDSSIAKAFAEAVRTEQLRDLERLWYVVDDDDSDKGRRFAADLLHLRERLGEKYQVEELDAKYEFTGREGMSVGKALEVKEELEAIDRLLEQLREAMKTARIGLVDLEELSRFVDEAGVDELREFGEQVKDFLRAEAERQGLEMSGQGLELSPRAYRIFQSKLLQEIFSDLEAARSGRHSGPIAGEGAVELPRTKPYEFGDSVANMDVGQTFINALIREGAAGGTEGQRDRGTKGDGHSGALCPFVPLSLRPSDIEIHRTRNNPKCATAVIMDMSGSMRHDGQYVNVKRMAIALDGLIRSEYPGDFLSFIEMYTFARVRTISEVAAIMPKPVTLRNPVVRLKVDMSDERISETMVPPHFTNIQRSLGLARQLLGAQDTPNRQVMLLTDGLPTAHYQGEHLYLLYPPDPATDAATMREAHACVKEGITINIFLLPSWWQSEEDVAFAHRLAEATRGRVFFTAGRDIDRYVLWDYVSMRRKIISRRQEGDPQISQIAKRRILEQLRRECNELVASPPISWAEPFLDKMAISSPLQTLRVGQPLPTRFTGPERSRWIARLPGAVAAGFGRGRGLCRSGAVLAGF
jgi:hypothetical protein